MTLQLTLGISHRWLLGKPKYRPLGEPIRPADYEAAEIPDDCFVLLDEIDSSERRIAFMDRVFRISS